MRVPPRLTAPQRRRGRVRGKSDSIDALAVAQGCAAGTAAGRAARRRGDAARAEAAGRPPRRPGRGAAPLPAAAALAPTRTRPDTRRAAGRARPAGLARPARPSARPPGADHAGTDRARPARPLPHTDPLDRRARPRTAHTHTDARTATAAARRLRSPECRQAALRDRPNRPLPQATRNSHATPASHHSTPAPANTNATASTAAATANSTAPCTASPSPKARVHPPARAYLERKQAEGKTRREAIRCLKRQLARTIYTTLKNEPLLT